MEYRQLVRVQRERALVVEDSPTGIRSGLDGRIPTAAVATNFPRETLAALKPTWLGDSMVEFFDWVRSLRA